MFGHDPYHPTGAHPGIDMRTEIALALMVQDGTDIFHLEPEEQDESFRRCYDLADGFLRVGRETAKTRLQSPGQPPISLDDAMLKGDGGLIDNRSPLGEGYPAHWKHCIIHLNPETGEMNSDGDHRVREWIEERIKGKAAADHDLARRLT